MCILVAGRAVNAGDRLAPTALCDGRDGSTLYVACARARCVLTFDAATGRVTGRVELPDAPSGLALGRDGKRLYVTGGSAGGSVAVVDVVSARVVETWPAGHTPVSPLVSPDGKTLYYARRFEGRVVAFDLETGTEHASVPVPREPIALAVTPDGQRLLVAHHLHDGRADESHAGAALTLIDAGTLGVVGRLALPAGSGLLRDVRVSPDGRLACVTHNLARFQLPTTQVDRGWMNTAAITLVRLDGPTPSVLNTVLLDDVDRGGANPWAAAWSDDGKTLAVSHAGTHELSLVDVPALTAKLARLVETSADLKPVDPNSASRKAGDVPNDLSFLVGLRRRVRLSGNGPRALAVAGGSVYAAGFFSDTLERIPLKPGDVRQTTSWPLGPATALTAEDRGERAFNDATLCFQGWQSCASCHSDEARSDGLNWDLLNDGIGNPKNSKSLLLSHVTPPAMSTAIRDTAETAVRSGMRHILFATPTESVARDIDAWLRSLRPLPSPHRIGGALSPAAKRGETVFRSAKAGCSRCHSGPRFTDQMRHDVGTAGRYDPPDETYDTPTLVELWRTAPYLHDGSVVTPRELIGERNPGDRHGGTSHLTPGELDDLAAYLLSL